MISQQKLQSVSIPFQGKGNFFQPLKIFSMALVTFCTHERSCHCNCVDETPIPHNIWSPHHPIRFSFSILIQLMASLHTAHLPKLGVERAFSSYSTFSQKIGYQQKLQEMHVIFQEFPSQSTPTLPCPSGSCHLPLTYHNSLLISLQCCYSYSPNLIERKIISGLQLRTSHFIGAR